VPVAPPIPWTPILLAWTALAAVFLPQALALNAMRPEPAPTWLVVLRNGQVFALWALFTPPIMAALRRWPPSGTARLHHGARLVLVAAGLVLAHVGVMAATTLALESGGIGPIRAVVGTLTGLGATNVLFAAATFTACAAVNAASARREAELRLGEARIERLREQLQPHLLFNSLNALAELVHADPLRAEALLLRLSALLRRALDGGGRRRVTLAEELSFLDDYLEIQSTLLGGRLRASRSIDTMALRALVPPMLLQPLVENALRHAISPRAEGGSLALEATVAGSTLALAVVDDGPGIDAGARDGVGLGNTRSRLAAEYGGRARLVLDRGPAGGTRATVSLPLERE
jgi:hypothetical protein